MTAHAKPAAFPEWLSSDDRKADRRRLELAVTIQSTNLPPEPARMTDLSPLGCGIATTARLHVGSYLTVLIPGFTTVEGWVAWRKPDCLGLDFSHQLPAKVVDHVVRSAG